jgi:2'-5' RNA ligase
MPSKIRSFIAIHLPEELIARISGFQDRLKRMKGDIRWVHPEAMHLTLKFLGDVDSGQMESIFANMAEAGKSVSPFDLTVRGTGVFPDIRRPRILWLGIESPVELIQLTHTLNDLLGSLGFKPEEREFHPHLTLGRVRSLQGTEPVIRTMMDSGFTGESFTVKSIFLMKSDLKPSGPEYTILQSIQL